MLLLHWFDEVISNVLVSEYENSNLLGICKLGKGKLHLVKTKLIRSVSHFNSSKSIATANG